MLTILMSMDLVTQDWKDIDQPYKVSKNIGHDSWLKNRLIFKGNANLRRVGIFNENMF